MAVLKEEVRAPLPPPPPPLSQGNEAAAAGGGGGGGGRQEDSNDDDENDDDAAAGERSRLMRMNGIGNGKEGDRVIDVRIPAKVYNDGVMAVRQALEAVVDVVVD